MVVGVIEIVAGVLVLARPRAGAWVVMARLLRIALAFITSRHYYDVAVRDMAMAACPWALARLSSAIDSPS